MAFYWDSEKKIYRDSEGNPIEESQIREWIDRMTQALALLFISRAEALKAVFNLETYQAWNVGNRISLNALHYAVTMIAFGGRSEMNDEEWQIAESVIGFQISKYDEFANGVFAGTIPMDGHFPVRTSLYALAGYSTYINGTAIRAGSQGFTEEKRIPTSGNPCVDCKTERAKGWQPLGTLRLIGDSVCLMRCRCFKMFR
jgi:hypothetical protein